MTTQVTVRFGVDSVTRTFDHAVSVGDVRRDTGIKAALGYGDSVRCLMNGIALTDDALLPSGASLTIETAANTKAVRKSTRSVRR